MNIGKIEAVAHLVRYYTINFSQVMIEFLLARLCVMNLNLTLIGGRPINLKHFFSLPKNSQYNTN